MKLIIASDLHVNRNINNFHIAKVFAQYCQEKQYPVLIAGDTADSAFQNKEHETRHKALMENIEGIVNFELRKRQKHKKFELSYAEYLNTFPIIAEDIVYNKHYPSEVKEFLIQYLKCLDDCIWYQNTLFSILHKDLAGLDIIAVPGNHDINLDFTVLNEFNAHKKIKKIEDVVVAGYGNAVYNEFDNRRLVNILPLTVNVPPELSAPFNEYLKHNALGGETELVSEPEQFLSSTKPDIALLHQPLYGYLDKVNGMHLGSLGSAKYASTGLTKIFVTGHVHECAGVEKVRTMNNKFAVAVNPGTLGNVHNNGGNFVVLDIDNNNEFVSAKFYQIRDNDIIPKKSYVRDDTNEIKMVEIYERAQLITDRNFILQEYQKLHKI